MLMLQHYLNTLLLFISVPLDDNGQDNGKKSQNIPVQLKIFFHIQVAKIQTACSIMVIEHSLPAT